MSLNQTRYNNSNEESRNKKTTQNENEKDDLINFEIRHQHDQEYMYPEDNTNVFNSLVAKYKEEIKMLKNYIDRLHREIRVKLNVEIPLFKDNQKLNENNKNNQEPQNKDINPENINNAKAVYEENKHAKAKPNTQSKIDLEAHSSLDIEFLKNYLEEVSTNLTDIYYLNPILIKYNLDFLMDHNI